MKRNKDHPDRLPSKSSAGGLIGGILAGLDHALTGRPKTPAQIEEQYREPWTSADGLTVDTRRADRAVGATRSVRREALRLDGDRPVGVWLRSVEQAERSVRHDRLVR